jgi:hypothetical protein
MQMMVDDLFRISRIISGHPFLETAREYRLLNVCMTPETILAKYRELLLCIIKHQCVVIRLIMQPEMNVSPPFRKLGTPLQAGPCQLALALFTCVIRMLRMVQWDWTRIVHFRDLAPVSRRAQPPIVSTSAPAPRPDLR